MILNNVLAKNSALEVGRRGEQHGDSPVKGEALLATLSVGFTHFVHFYTKET